MDLISTLAFPVVPLHSGFGDELALSSIHLNEATNQMYFISSNTLELYL